MTTRIVNSACLLILFLGISHFCYARPDSLQQVRALLVMLRSEQNRINFFKKSGDEKRLQQIYNDASEAATAMIDDFRDNFYYCPVYYFFDSNLNHVLNGEFKNILFDSNRIMVHLKGIFDTNNLIVCYGYPVEQSRRERVVKDKSRYVFNSGEPHGKGLIISNYKFQQVSYLYRLEDDGQIYTTNERGRLGNYTYKSKHFDLEYFPFARQLNEKLYKNPKKIRISFGISDDDDED